MFTAKNNIETVETTTEENLLVGPVVLTTYNLDISIDFSKILSSRGLAYDSHKKVSKAIPKIKKIIEECFEVDND